MLGVQTNNQKKYRKDTTIAIIASNLSKNGMGRAYMLADMLDPFFDVKIYGFFFNKDSCSLWEPLKKINIPVASYKGCEFPEFTGVLKSIAPKIKADIILVSKPRLPSMQLGLLIKSLGRQPLIIDIDDYEIGFFSNNITLDENDIKNPLGEVWTRYCEHLIGYSDDIFVSNVALQAKYGGILIPHARDEKKFNPSLYNKVQRRKELGIPLEDKIVLFLGTPREHKGLLQMSEAIKELGNPSYKLCIIGSFPRKELKDKLLALGDKHLMLFPDQPFDDIAKNVAIADLVCILQDVKSRVAQYQLPAKVIDAIAMGIPVLANETPPLKPLIDQGLIFPTNKNNFADDLKKLLSRQDFLQKEILRDKSVFLKEYSYSAVFAKIEKAIINSIKKSKALPDQALSYMELQSGLFDDAKKLLQSINGKYLEIELAEIEKQYRKMLHSRSWRYTEPLRKSIVFLKRLFTKQPF